jgi:hypothetical protein
VSRELKYRSIGAARCVRCGGQIAQGAWMLRVRVGKFEHVTCPEEKK